MDNQIRDIINREESLLEVLRAVKSRTGCLDHGIIKSIAEEMNLSPSKVEGVATFYNFLGMERDGRYIIRVCKTISCHMEDKKQLIKNLEKETGTRMGESSRDGLFTLRECNCLGMCDQGPALLINDTLLSSVKSGDVHGIIKSCRERSFNKNFDHRYESKIYETGPLYEFLSNRSSKLKSIVKLTPEEIITKIEDSGLKGRGGAGFFTGLKWRMAYETEADEKYIVCNADEGEPGTFKDRFILDNYPDKVVEGMIIGARAVGAKKGFIYLRGEYAYLYKKLKKTVDSYDFTIDIHLGSGSYVCGEETALIESLEGSRGEPRNKPPYPARSGYNGYPTVINNVETLLDVCLIMEKGVDLFKSIGTHISRGTKFFSISGDCPKPGIYEFPFGTTLYELLISVGAKDIKSVHLGGASGRNISSRDFKTVIAYEAVPSGGSIILFNKNRNMLKVAKNFMEFFVSESCGQCLPCREGTKQMLRGINRLLNRNGDREDISDLIRLGMAVMDSSKCGLGQVCATSFISIINNFQEEIIRDIEE